MMNSPLPSRFSPIIQDKSGALDKTELKTALEKIAETETKLPAITPKDVDAAFTALDKNKSGKIEREEFVKLIELMSFLSICELKGTN